MSEKDKALSTLAALGISTAEEDLHVMPSSGEFITGNLLAAWNVHVMHWFLTEDDCYEDGFDAGPDFCEPDIRSEVGGWYSMFYHDYDKALASMHAISPLAAQEDYKPEEHWVFVTTPDKVLNRTPEAIENMREGFGETIVFHVRIMQLRDGSQRFPMWKRHNYSLLALPCAVAALADVHGYDHAGFDVDDILAITQASDYSKEKFHELCGYPDGVYGDSVLFKRRAALWNSLGEEDPTKDQVIGSKTAKGKASKGATASEKLSNCLAIAQGTVKQALYLRLANVVNPAAYQSEKKVPTKIPVILEIFLSATDAFAAAEAELESQGVDTEELGMIPEQWKGSDLSVWISHVRANDDPTITAGGPPPMAEKRKKHMAEVLYCETWEQVEAARQYIAENPVE